MGNPEAPTTVRRRLVENQCCIDVSVLHKAGKLVPGTCSIWTWSRGTGVVGAVCLVAEADAIEICGYVSTGTRIEPVQEVTRITSVPARFANRPCGRGRGATSTFLLCPGCQSRRRKLYIVGPQEAGTTRGSTITSGSAAPEARAAFDGRETRKSGAEPLVILQHTQKTAVLA